MISKFPIHNAHFTDGKEGFRANDPQLRSLGFLRYVFHQNWWQEIARQKTPGIYILRGGRQIGKTTSLKLLMLWLLEEGAIPAEQIFFLPCDQVIDRQELYRHISAFVDSCEGKPFFLMVDELTFIDKWELTLKALADEGRFQKGVCIVTGSDSVVLEQAAMYLPGRRGKHAQVDFTLYPLSFAQIVELVEKRPASQLTDAELDAHFEKYLLCGGYLTAVNDVYESGAIAEATRSVYENWVYGDFLRRGKKRENLDEVLDAVFATLGTQITYSSLTQRTAHLVKDTFIDYIHLLERMDVLLVQEAFDPSKNRGFPKKAKKLVFRDPFIAQALAVHRQARLDDSLLAEQIVVSHYARDFPVYYWKGQGEIDLIYQKEKKPYAIEVKWRNQVRPKDLQELQKFKNALVLTKTSGQKSVDGVPCEGLVRRLAGAN